MNKKFLKKVDKIIDFLEQHKVDIDYAGENTLTLLKKLRSIQDLSERNDVIDKIESIVTDVFNKTTK